MPVYQNSKTKLWEYRTYATDIYGKRKQFEKGGFTTKKEAREAERQLQSLETVGEYKLTFQQLWEHYKQHIVLKQKVQSYRKTTSKFDNHILPYFKDYMLTAITNNIYIKWQNKIESKKFKHSYNSSLDGSMVTILNYAIKFYGLKQNIASLTGNFIKKLEVTKNVDFWTLEEYQTFIQSVDNKIYHTFFKTLYYTGLRQGECLALTWNDLQENYLDINKTISKEKIDGEYIINSPKTKESVRKVKIDSKLLTNLLELKSFYQERINFSTEWFIFGGIIPLAPSTIGRKKDYYCKQSKVKKIRIHDFRHSHASLLISNGIPITVISKRLGHSDRSMTLNTYSHMLPNDEDRAVDIITNIKKSDL